MMPAGPISTMTKSKIKRLSHPNMVVMVKKLEEKMHWILLLHSQPTWVLTTYCSTLEINSQLNISRVHSSHFMVNLLNLKKVT